jgi:hypothetical protein
MPRRQSERVECLNCDHYRWITETCTLDRDEIHDRGLTCPEWQPIKLTQQKAPTQ